MHLLRAVVLTSLGLGYVFGQSYTITTFAGGALPVNIPGTSGSIGLATGVAVDSTGNVFMASSTYNAVPRPAAVLVANGRARVIRRRETIADLLAPEIV